LDLDRPNWARKHANAGDAPQGAGPNETELKRAWAEMPWTRRDGLVTGSVTGLGLVTGLTELPWGWLAGWLADW
jgi:hypothetical protein